MDDDVLFHVKRGDLPWRTATLTECGIKIDKNPTITRGELLERIRRKGDRKTELQCCQTCWSTSNRYHWGHNERDTDEEMMWTLHREIQRPRRAAHDGHLGPELRALGLLVDVHREEFEELVQSAQAIAHIDKRVKPA